MLVKCKLCGEKVDRDIAHKVVVGGANHYYCSKKEYDTLTKEKQCRQKVFEISDKIFGYKVMNNALNKDLTEICKIHTYSTIYNFLYEKRDKIGDILSSKDFQSEYAKIKYFCAIIKNKIEDYKRNTKADYIKEVETEIVIVSYKKRKVKKSLDEIMEEYDE